VDLPLCRSQARNGTIQFIMQTLQVEIHGSQLDSFRMERCKSRLKTFLRITPLKKSFMAVLALAILVGCSSEPSKPSEAEKPQPKSTELDTGRTAFQRMYVAARGWARDTQAYKLESSLTSDGTGKDGKSAVWRAGFASASMKGTKPYTWSGSIAPNAPDRGVTPGSEDSYNPNNSSTAVFDIAYLKIDSDKALEVAHKHGGDKILEKAPDTPILYILDWSRATNELIWHVIYGSDRDNAKLRVAVNASTGEFIRVEK